MTKFIDIIKAHYGQKDTIKSVEMWFDEYHVKSTPDNPEKLKKKLFEPGKIYTFRYLADHTLRYYDLHPVFMCIYNDVVDKKIITYGINFSYVPPKVRIQIINIIYSLYYHKGIEHNIKAVDAGKETKKLVFDYRILKRLLANTGYQLSICTFGYGKIMGKPTIITYSDWWRICFLTPKFIHKINASSLYYLYNVNKSKNNANNEGYSDRSEANNQDS
jgi:hypothetical protein